jgi:hypothetical protein
MQAHAPREKKTAETWMKEVPIRMVSANYPVGTKKVEGDPNTYLVILGNTSDKVLKVVGRKLRDATAEDAKTIPKTYLVNHLSARYGDSRVKALFSEARDQKEGVEFVEHGSVWITLSPEDAHDLRKAMNGAAKGAHAALKELKPQGDSPARASACTERK